MALSRETKSKLPGAEESLYQFLRINYLRNSRNTHKDIAAHQERMESINKILANDGGQKTVEDTITRINAEITKTQAQLDDNRTKHKQFRKKHPFRYFSSPCEHDVARITIRRSMNCPMTIRNELVAASSLNNIIEQSRSNKPKLG